MISWYLLLGVLALLIIILLFGFVGCEDLVEASADGYFFNVTTTPGLIAYWRLGEGQGDIVATNQVESGPAGIYSTLEDQQDPDFQHHSPATSGSIGLGITPGLLGDQHACIVVDGGFVRVPFDDNLNHKEFTFEAWVFPGPLGLDENFFYCLAEATGPMELDQEKKKGWGLYLGPDDPDNPSGLFWQVWMGDGDHLNRVAIAHPDFPKDGEGKVISPNNLTYLALTFDGSQNLQLWLFYPNTGQGLDIEDLQALEIPNPPIIFRRNDAADDGQGDLFIGTGSNLFPDAGFPSHRLYPFKGRIQEVALYDKDLSAPDNDGVMDNLLSHFMSAQSV